MEKVWKDIGGNQEEMISGGKFGRVYNAEIGEKIERRERLAPRNKVESGKHLEVYGGLSEGIGMKTCLHAAQWTSKMLKQRLRVGDLDLPERINRYTSSREEEVDAQMCPCGKAIP